MTIKDPKDYLYYGPKCLIDDVTYSLSAGAKLKLQLDEPDDYRAFESITKRSGKRAGQVLKVLLRRPGEEEFMPFDAWFAGWTVSHSKGAIVAMTLDMDGFDTLTSSNKGDPVEVMIYKIENDGEHYNEEERQKVEAKLKGGPISIQAGKACQDPGFHRFIEEAFELPLGKIKDGAAAATFVRSHCGIESRAELDHNPKAGATWKLLYKRYLGTSL